MRLKKPTRVLIDQVRITREGSDAIIDHADAGISGTRITVGPDIATMTDREIIDVFNGILAAQERLLAAWDKTVIDGYRRGAGFPKGAVNSLGCVIGVFGGEFRLSMDDPREACSPRPGNGGAAIAAYAAAGGIKAKILVPATTQPGKTVQMRAYGAEVELIPGTRQDTADEAQRQAERMFYASHNWQAFFLQGTKTLAYELWEDLGFRAPDNVLIPTGAGSNVLGCDIASANEARRSPRQPRRSSCRCAGHRRL